MSDEFGRCQGGDPRGGPLFKDAAGSDRSQACFRPATQDGLPLIGKVPHSEGIYVATGHSVWGILNAPATGEALAKLIAEGVSLITELKAFDPARLRP
jgi:glycine/D-amino acid oxidase-like deaminating enzyme